MLQIYIQMPLCWPTCNMGYKKHLHHKGKRRKPLETRGLRRFLTGIPISQSPKEVRKREAFGHWELDTIVSSRGKSRACAATFIERKTRMYMALKMPDRTAYSMKVAFWCNHKPISASRISER